MELLDEEAPGPQVGGGEGHLHHLVLLLAKDEHELLLLDGHSFQPVGQGGPRLIGEQTGVQVNEGQQAVNLYVHKCTMYMYAENEKELVHQSSEMTTTEKKAIYVCIMYVFISNESCL